MLVLIGVLLVSEGMFLFTALMGNAFAAFPIMTAAIDWPVLVQIFDGNPGAVFAIGMLSGFCGTLITPMAANFNLVPSALLEMKDKYGVIKAQVGTGVPMLGVNVALTYFLAFSTAQRSGAPCPTHQPFSTHPRYWVGWPRRTPTSFSTI